MTQNDLQQGHFRDGGLCQWAHEVKPGWLPNFQFNNRTFRLVWQKPLLKMEWRVMLSLHFSFNKHFCISNQEKVTGFESWNKGWYPISQNFQLGTIWVETSHRSIFKFLLKRHTRTQKALWDLHKSTQDLWARILDYNTCVVSRRPCGSFWIFFTGP